MQNHLQNDIWFMAYKPEFFNTLNLLFKFMFTTT